MRRTAASRIGLILGLTALVGSTSVASSSPVAGGPAAVGRWAKPFWEGGSLPFDPPSREKSKLFPAALNVAVLPDGRVLYWNGLEKYEDSITHFDYPRVAENDRSRILDLRGPSPAWTIPTPERGNDEPIKPNFNSIFCVDQKLLYDGTVLLAGGQSLPLGANQVPLDVVGIKKTRIFDPADNTFRFVGDMTWRRWYPSLVTLSDGRVLVLSGVEQIVRPEGVPFGVRYNNVTQPEIYDPTMRAWTLMADGPYSWPVYSHLHLMPGGKVLYPAAGYVWVQGGTTLDELSWSEQQLYDAATDTWAEVGDAKYGTRDGASVLLRLEPPYDTARVLIAGGTIGPYVPEPIATTLSETLTIRGDTVTNDGGIKSPLAGLTGDKTQLHHARWVSSPTLLPTGEVILFNGADINELVIPGAEAGVRVPEIYDPATDTWRDLAPSSRVRTEHNTAVLLPDGRVLIGGHAPIRLSLYQPARSNSFRDSTFEIYSPPYLFRGPRPEIGSVDAGDGTGLSITLTGPVGAADVSDVVAVRLPSMTHSIDGDQRAVKLPATMTGPNTLQVLLPNGGDGSILPPGPYYLFVLSRTPNGPVPSISKTIFSVPAGGGTVRFTLTPPTL